MAYQMRDSRQDKTYWSLESRGDKMWLPSKNERVTARVPCTVLGTRRQKSRLALSFLYYLNEGKSDSDCDLFPLP